MSDQEHEEGAKGGIDFNDESIQAKIREIVDTKVAEEVSGLKNVNQSLKDEKKKLKEKLDKVKEESDKFSSIFEQTGIDQETATKLLMQVSKDEEARLVAEGKFDEVLNKRVGLLKSEHSSQLSNQEKIIGELKSQVDSLQTKINTDMVTNEVRKAAAKVGVESFAIEDALLYCQNNFTIEEDRMVCYENGEKVYGSDGVTPISVEEYLNGKRESKPHWFSKPVGGGAMGSQGRDGSEPNPWRKDSWNFTEQNRIARENPDKAKRLQKAATGR